MKMSLVFSAIIRKEDAMCYLMICAVLLLAAYDSINLCNGAMLSIKEGFHPNWGSRVEISDAKIYTYRCGQYDSPYPRPQPNNPDIWIHIP